MALIEANSFSLITPKSTMSSRSPGASPTSGAKSAMPGPIVIG